MNVTYGLFPPLEEDRKRKRAARRLAMAERALADLEGWWREVASTSGNCLSTDCLI